MSTVTAPNPLQALFGQNAVALIAVVNGVLESVKTNPTTANVVAQSAALPVLVAAELPNLETTDIAGLAGYLQTVLDGFAAKFTVSVKPEVSVPGTATVSTGEVGSNGSAA